MKTPRLLKILALIWGLLLLATLYYRYGNWINYAIAGKWFNESYGIVEFTTDGTVIINGTKGTWEKIKTNTIQINFSRGGAHINVTREYGGMTWKIDNRSEYSFEKLPTKESASIDRTIETAPEAMLIRRWTENSEPQRLIVLPDGSTGFDDNFIRLFLNSKLSAKLSPDEWLYSFTKITHTGKIIDKLEDIPGYQDSPLQNPPEAVSTTTQTPEGLSKVTRHSYLQLRGKFYRIEASFRNKHCLEISQQLIEQHIGAEDTPHH